MKYLIPFLLAAVMLLIPLTAEANPNEYVYLEVKKTSDWEFPLPPFAGWQQTYGTQLYEALWEGNTATYIYDDWWDPTHALQYHVTPNKDLEDRTIIHAYWQFTESHTDREKIERNPHVMRRYGMDGVGLSGTVLSGYVSAEVTTPFTHNWWISPVTLGKPYQHQWSWEELYQMYVQIENHNTHGTAQHQYNLHVLRLAVLVPKEE